MENDLFTKAVHSLRQPQDKKKLLQILIVIRKGIDESSTKSENFKILNESSCVKNLLACLQMESCSILDITLSILGNSCIDSNFARNSMKLNILHYLDRVIGKHSKDSIVGRIFRIIGNLCDNVCSTIIMAKEPQLIDKLVRLLNKAAAEKDANVTNHVSEATMLMALRTIRKLLKKSTLDNLIVKHGVLKAIGAVLIKYAEDPWEVNSSSANVIEEILRLLYAYSRYEHLQIIPSLKNTESGDSLATLGKLIVLNPTRVMKIITNLNKSCLLKSDLPMPDVWQKLLEKAKSNAVSENTYLEYLRSMYKLIDHPSNRKYIKLGDSICDLVNILKDFTVCTDFSLECSTIIISMLRMCQFDDSLVLKQINAGIVSVLIDKLEWTGVSSMKLTVPNHVKKKRKTKEYFEGEIKKVKLLIDRDSFGNLGETVLIPYEDRCSSPSELSEISSNGPYSPSCAAIAEDVSDSDNYSPVCSDAEDTDVNSIPSLDPECVTPSDDDDIVSGINVRMKYRFLHEINTLLWRYSRIEPAIAELGSPKLLTTLMNIAFSNENSISPHKFVMFVMKKADYLIPLMQTNFIQMIFDLTITAHDTNACHSCKHAHETATVMLEALTKVAESGGAKGNIAHVLLRSNAQVKNKIVLAIPYVVRNKHTVTKLLINCGGLDVLLNLLEKKSDVQEDSIKGLCILAIHQLKIKNPVFNQPQRQVLDLDVNSYSLSETCTNVVTFKLDDGSAVSADRDFLSDKSDYFNRLLNGCFMESEQSEITLQNISIRSLKLLLILLHRNTSSMGVVNVDLDTLLDLLEITERYLLVELNVYLMNCVEQLHMSNKTVPIIYQWSIESGTNILRVETIAFALVGNIVDADRIHMFHDLFSLGYHKQLRDDIQKLLVRFLR